MGFALVGALVVVVLLGALIVGTFVAATEETRISGSVARGTRALSSAESAVDADAGGWAPGLVDSIGIAQSASHTVTSNEFAVVTTLIRLDTLVYWLVGEATDAARTPSGAPFVRRRIGLLLRRVSDSTGRASLLRVEERSWSELF